MNHRKTLYLLLVAVVIGGLSCSPQQSGSDDPFVGKPAPGFTLRRLNGGEVSLSQLQGRIVLLDFWATWCGPCRMSMPVLERLQQQNASDVTLLAVNLMEEPELVHRFVRQHGIHSTVLMDAEGNVGRTYRASSIPMQVLVDQKGVIRHVQLGYNPRMGELLNAEIEKLRNAAQ